MNRALLLMVAPLAVAAGCERDPVLGDPCVPPGGCGDGYYCAAADDGGFSGACLPVPVDEGPGLCTATNRYFLDVVPGDAVPGSDRPSVRGELFLVIDSKNDDDDEFDTSCGPADRVETVVQLDASTLPGESNLRVRVTAAAPLSVELLRDVEGCDPETRVPFTCAVDDAGVAEVLIPRFSPNAYVLVIETEEQPGPLDVHVTVEDTGCPLGAVPDEGECLQWVQEAPLTFARSGHSVTALPDGRIVAAGGRDADGAPVLSVEVYDPRTRLWSQQRSTMVEPASHGVALDPEGQLYLAGARSAIRVLDVDPTGPPVLAVDLLRPGSPRRADDLLRLDIDPFSLEQYEVVALGTSTSSLLSDGSLLVRGRPGLLRLARDLEVDTEDCPGDVCFDAFTLAGGDTLQARTGHAAVTVRRGTRRAGVLFVGDESALEPAEFFDEGSGLLQPIGEGPEPLLPRRNPVALNLDGDDRVVVLLGEDAGGAPVADVELFNVSANVVERRGALRTPRLGANAIGTANGDVVVIGGRQGDVLLPATELLDRSFSSRRGPELLTPRTDVAVARSATGDVFVVGGRDGSDAPSAAVERLARLPPRTSAPIVGDACEQTSTALEDDIVFGSTVAGDDLQVHEGCGSGASRGPDVVYRVSLPEPRSVTVSLLAPSPIGIPPLMLYAARGCGGSDLLACGEAIASGNVELFLPEVSGELFVTVDAVGFDADDINASAFSIRLDAASPVACVDDALSALAPLTTLPRLQAVGAPPHVSGTLCPGNVAHAYLSTAALSRARPQLRGLPAALFRAAPVDIDVEASAASGELVGTVGEYEPLSPEQRFEWQGPHLLAVGPLAPGVLYGQWSFSVDEGCGVDGADAAVVALDDGTFAPARPQLGDRPLERSSCRAGDVDVTLVDIPAGGAVIVDASGFINAELLAVSAAGSLGAVVASAPGVLDAVLAPPAAGRYAVRTTAPGIVERITLRRRPTAQGPTCDVAVPLEGSAGTEFGTTDGAGNDTDASDLDPLCTGFESPGDDVFRSVFLRAGEELDVVLTPLSSADVSVYVLDACPAVDCLGGSDVEGYGAADRLVFTAPDDGTYFIALDAFSSGPFEFQLDWAIRAP